MSTDTDIAALNSLIETTIDSADGYEQAAASAPDAKLAQLFRSSATERRAIVADLRQHVTRLGGTAEDDGSLLASAHRAFLSLKASISTATTQATLEEVARGERHLAAKYDDAARTADLSPGVATAIQSAAAQVKAGATHFVSYGATLNA